MHHDQVAMDAGWDCSVLRGRLLETIDRAGPTRFCLMVSEDIPPV